jgi:two-component system sporulation sensor kinase B
MFFPINYFPEYGFDLRAVLILLGFLYGGAGVGCILAGVMLVVRILMDLQYIWVAAVNLSFMLILFSWLLKRFTILPMRKKLWTGSLFACAAGGFIILLYNAVKMKQGLINGDHFLYRMAGFSTLHGAAACMGIYLFETIKKNKLIRTRIFHQEKLHMLGDMAASVAHEIRNPMTVARGFMQLINNRELSAASVGKYVPVVMEELDRAEAVIEDYLSMVRPQNTDWEKLQMHEQLFDAAALMKDFAEQHKVDIRLHLQDGLVCCYDKRALSRLIVNLLNNAVEAMPDGGKLDVELIREADFAKIRIRDTGYGMTEEEVNRLGSLFYSTKTKGTGIGLLICYKIVETAGGTIQVDSKKGQGTVITLRLPLSDQNPKTEGKT